jgi:hypothetical protein
MESFDWSNCWGYSLLPAICSFGCLTNCTNILVLINPKMKDISFKYILAKSLADFFYLLLCTYIFVEYCSDYSLYTVYFTQWYIIYIDIYLTSCLAVFIILTDISVSFIRYTILKNKPFLQSISPFKVIGFLLITSLIYYFPVLFFSSIQSTQQINNTTNTDYNNEYYVINTQVGSSLYGKITPIILSVIRIILSMFVLTGLNIMNAYEFRKRYSNRVKQKGPLQTESIYYSFSLYQIFNL